ncbi:hypothetical protein BV22DRAFT_967375, partial [Leucogyrophana mollusca]
ANRLLRDGMLINSLKLHPHKDKKEPLRWVHCHHWGHMAKACTTSEDTCRTCGEGHCTADCTGMDKVYCVSCNDSTHAGWSCGCPEFGRQCRDLDVRYPENGMPYFPTKEPW